MRIVQLDHAVPLLQQGSGKNDCGPHAIAMAVGFYRPQDCDPASMAREIRFFRLPWVGATLPWGVTFAIRRHSLAASGGWFQALDGLRAHLARNHPVIVIVRPTDFAACPRYALHYRVAVGYHDDASLQGGGEVYFNCSATPPDSGRYLPGNLSIDYHQFRRQWRTYLTWNWAIEVAPALRGNPNACSAEEAEGARGL